jgi:hypothetical protein
MAGEQGVSASGTFHEPQFARALPPILPLPFRRGEGRGEGSVLAVRFMPVSRSEKNKGLPLNRLTWKPHLKSEKTLVLESRPLKCSGEGDLGYQYSSPTALWSTQATAPASGPQIPFRLRRTRHDLRRRGLSGPCAPSSGSRENGLSSVLVCGHTVHTLLMF